MSNDDFSIMDLHSILVLLKELQRWKYAAEQSGFTFYSSSIKGRDNKAKLLQLLKFTFYSSSIKGVFWSILLKLLL